MEATSTGKTRKDFLEVCPLFIKVAKSNSAPYFFTPRVRSLSTTKIWGQGWSKINFEV